jgi:hypothetical protein
MKAEIIQARKTATQRNSSAPRNIANKYLRLSAFTPDIEHRPYSRRGYKAISEHDAEI